MILSRRLRNRLLARLHDPRGRGQGRGPKMFDAGALRYIVLQLIAEQPRHGYEIIKAIEKNVGGDYAPSPGAIYPLLALLEDLGHVSVTPDGNKKLHKITREGQAFLDKNRAFVDAVVWRMRMLGGTGRRGEGAIRTAMHAVKAALMARSREDNFTAEQGKHIAAILEHAAAEIRKLS